MLQITQSVFFLSKPYDVTIRSNSVVETIRTNGPTLGLVEILHMLDTPYVSVSLETIARWVGGALKYDFN